MKIIDTKGYFKKNINKKHSLDNFSNNGKEADSRGKGFEKELEFLCNKKSKTKKEKELLKEIFGKEIKKAEVLEHQKSDIEILYKDGKKEYFSLKNTGAISVGALEVCQDSIIKYFDNKKFEKSLKSYKKTRFTKSSFQKNYEKDSIYFEKFLHKNLKKYLEYVLKESGPTPPDSIIFLDKKTNLLYISSIEEYVELILKYGTKSTLNTYTSITRTSGDYCYMKIKVPNPFRMKKFKENNYKL